VNSGLIKTATCKNAFGQMEMHIRQKTSALSMRMGACRVRSVGNIRLLKMRMKGVGIPLQMDIGEYIVPMITMKSQFPVANVGKNLSTLGTGGRDEGTRLDGA
jgi:hypothetical protein